MMNKELIEKSIQKEEIQLRFYQKLIHYRLSIISVIIALLCLTDGFQDFSFEFNIEEIKIQFALFFTFISLITFLSQRNRLKLSYLSIYQTENLFNKIIQLADERKWSISLEKNNALILKTQRRYTGGKYFISKSCGENIYIFLKPGKILFRSLSDLERNTHLIVPNGENIENEKYIKQVVKPSANSRHD